MTDDYFEFQFTNNCWQKLPKQTERLFFFMLQILKLSGAHPARGWRSKSVSNLRKQTLSGPFSSRVLRVWGNRREQLAPCLCHCRVILNFLQMLQTWRHRRALVFCLANTHSHAAVGHAFCAMQQKWQVLALSCRVDVQHKCRQNSKALLMNNKSTLITQCQRNHLSLTCP